MQPKKIATSQKNRKCITPGCKRVLSIYNHNRHCHADLTKQARQENWRIESPEDVR